MARLPQVGGDSGNWGAVLNDFLTVELNADGTLKKAGDIATAQQTAQTAQSTAQSAQTTAQAAQAAVDVKYTKPTSGIPEADLASAVQAKLNAASINVLDDLADVNIGAAVDGQALVFQGTQWSAATINTSGTGVTDHSALTGLADDDHPQYHNDARGDARYYTRAQVDTSMGTKVNTTLVGAVNGVASLGADGKVPSAQLPTATTGGNSFTIVNRTSAYTASSYDFVICDGQASGFTVTLPPVAVGAWVRIKKTDSTTNAIIVVGQSSATINNQTSYVLNIQYASQDIMSDGTNWHLI